MKSWSFLLLYFFITISGVCQSNVIEWGKSIKRPSKSYHQKFLGKHSNGSFSLLRRAERGFLGNDQKIWLETYNELGDLERLLKIENPFKYEKSRNVYVEDIFYLNNAFHVFYSSYRKSDSVFICLRGILNEIHSVDAIVYDTIINTKIARAHKNTISFQESKDQSKLLLVFDEGLEGSKAQKHCWIYDQIDKNVLYVNLLDMPYSTRNFELNKIRIRNNGDLFFLGRKYRPIVDSVKVNYHYSIHQYLIVSSQWKFSELKIDSLFISSCNLEIDERNGQVVFAGYFSPKSQYRVKGVFYSRYDIEENKLIGISLKKFDDEFLKSFSIEVLKRTNPLTYEPELLGFELDKIQLRSDGGIVLIAEYFDEYTSSYRQVDAHGNYSLYQDYHYDFNSILVTNIQPNGEILWSKRIPKLQSTLNDGGKYSSYFYFAERGYLNFIFNDHEKNSGRNTELWPMNNPRKAIISQVKIDVDGNLSKRDLLNNEKDQLIMRAVLCKQIFKDKLLLYTESKKKYQFGILSF